MHKLNRPTAPICLTQFHHGRNHWSDLTAEDRNQIWEQLDLMQKKRCAYCEASIETTPGSRDTHIEHFHQRGRYPQGTFEWGNLFGSCNRENSCGKHKDKVPVYDQNVLIKMDEEDPEDYFAFISDGTIHPKPDLEEHEKRKATETLRIFNIDSERGPLRYMRKATVQGYVQLAEEYYQMLEEFDEEEVRTSWTCSVTWRTLAGSSSACENKKRR